MAAAAARAADEARDAAARAAATRAAVRDQVENTGRSYTRTGTSAAAGRGGGPNGHGGDDDDGSGLNESTDAGLQALLAKAIKAAAPPPHDADGDAEGGGGAEAWVSIIRVLDERNRNLVRRLHANEKETHSLRTKYDQLVTAVGHQGGGGPAPLVDPTHAPPSAQLPSPSPARGTAPRARELPKSKSEASMWHAQMYRARFGMGGVGMTESPI